jgi:hypothetical protein
MIRTVCALRDEDREIPGTWSASLSRRCRPVICVELSIIDENQLNAVQRHNTMRPLSRWRCDAGMLGASRHATHISVTE